MNPFGGIYLIMQGIEQLRPNLGVQVQKPNLPTQNQFLLASQQQVLAQAQSQNNLGNSAGYGDIDPRRFSGVPRGSMNAKDGQSTRNEGSIRSPVQSSSPKVIIIQSHHTEVNSPHLLRTHLFWILLLLLFLF